MGSYHGRLDSILFAGGQFGGVSEALNNPPKLPGWCKHPSLGVCISRFARQVTILIVSPLRDRRFINGSIWASLIFSILFGAASVIIVFDHIQIGRAHV